MVHMVHGTLPISVAKILTSMLCLLEASPSIISLDYHLFWLASFLTVISFNYPLFSKHPSFCLPCLPSGSNSTGWTAEWQIETSRLNNRMHPTCASTQQTKGRNHKTIGSLQFFFFIKLMDETYCIMVSFCSWDQWLVVWFSLNLCSSLPNCDQNLFIY